MSRQDVLDLWLRHLDGAALAADERQRLHDGLERDGALREVVLSDHALDGMLRAHVLDHEGGRRFTAGVATLIAAGDDRGRFAAQVQARLGRTGRWRTGHTRQRWLRPAAAAAALLVALLGWYWLPPHGAAPGTERPVAPADLPSDAATGQRLAIGSALRPASPRTLTWSDGTRAVLAPGSALTIGDPTTGKRVVLEAGTLQVVAAPQPADRPFTLRTPRAEAVVVGTSFTLSADAERTRLKVDHGLVRLLDGAHGGRAVGAGQTVVCDRFGSRAPGQPVFVWEAAGTTGPQPVLGRRTTAPDGRPCVQAERHQEAVQVVAMTFHRPDGWCAYDPRTVVTCRVWLGDSVKWAGFYVQDYVHHRHGQWHVPLDQRNAWREVRFTLGELEGTTTPPPAAGDVLHILMLQAQFAPGAELYIDRLVLTPTE